ncbi:MAG: alanine racemase domain protein [Pelosinus sp.]|jgi:predicted amino acid racemase|nr:alanine racemase domain protein [Pelosinus sp.]
MPEGTTLEVDLDKIIFNTSQVVEKCHRLGIAVLGVTKGFSAMHQIVSAMVEGGVDGLADARMENIIDLRKRNFDQEITLLRLPHLSNVENIVRYADTSINSEMMVIEALAETAKAINKIHKIILMVDVGDLREGLFAGNVLNAVKQISDLEGVSLSGLGTNMGCFGGILPSPENLGVLVGLANAVESKIGRRLEVVSGGGTSSLSLVEKNNVPVGINQLRIGEGILLGTDTTHNRRIPWLLQDAFLLRAEVIEVKRKPSVPIGDIGRDAFGNVPHFIDKGVRNRAILALGKQDVDVEGITPINEKIKIMGASSDHLILDITDCEQDIKVGDQIEFSLSYSGLLSVSDSSYVAKTFKRRSL